MTWVHVLAFYQVGFFVAAFFFYSVRDALRSQCSTTSDAYPWTSVKKTQTLICICTFSSVRQAQREIIPNRENFISIGPF